MVAIRVEGLGKCYRLAGAESGRFRYRTLRDSLAGLVSDYNLVEARFLPDGEATILSLAQGRAGTR